MPTTSESRCDQRDSSVDTAACRQRAGSGRAPTRHRSKRRRAGMVCRPPGYAHSRHKFDSVSGVRVPGPERHLRSRSNESIERCTIHGGPDNRRRRLVPVARADARGLRRHIVPSGPLGPIRIRSPGARDGGVSHQRIFEFSLVTASRKAAMPLADFKWCTRLQSTCSATNCRYLGVSFS